MVQRSKGSKEQKAKRAEEAKGAKEAKGDIGQKDGIKIDEYNNK